MRLLNTETLELKEFFRDIPPYAIVSHRWEEEEVSFQQLTKPEAKAMKGYAKIQQACAQARKHEPKLDYAWIDTCCIDKTDSTELAEAINSMFKWYEEAAICYAFLSDVPPGEDPQEPDSSIHKSKWFTRGWTLQELLAPKGMLFYASDWTCIADRGTLAQTISSITGIGFKYLEGEIMSSHHPNTLRRNLLFTASVAERMSWASARQTVRAEDRAYSLLGLFGVNMPLLYGEGENAFLRLQEEIIRSCFDPSLLAWNVSVNNIPLPRTISARPSTMQMVMGMVTGRRHPWYHVNTSEGDHVPYLRPASSALAASPDDFQGCSNIVTEHVPVEWSLTSMGLKIKLPKSHNRDPFIVLPCRTKEDHDALLALPLKRIGNTSFGRRRLAVHLFDHRMWWQWQQEEILLATKPVPERPLSHALGTGFWLRSMPDSVRLLRVSHCGERLVVRGGQEPPLFRQYPPLHTRAIFLLHTEEVGYFALIIGRYRDQPSGFIRLPSALDLDDIMTRVEACSTLLGYLILENNNTIEWSCYYRHWIDENELSVLDIRTRSSRPIIGYRCIQFLRGLRNSRTRQPAPTRFNSILIFFVFTALLSQSGLFQGLDSLCYIYGTDEQAYSSIGRALCPSVKNVWLSFLLFLLIYYFAPLFSFMFPRDSQHLRQFRAIYAIGITIVLCQVLGMRDSAISTLVHFSTVFGNLVFLHIHLENMIVMHRMEEMGSINRLLYIIMIFVPLFPRQE
ncbi:heterokaryon incompatibility protein-domain-containing protein [Stachybotrys elegans]|uniref:Heterokaryon incompatibility protein-domain-containing protein n=1 Tax=Stachybotrys elegans TaxID=80388 RepID=A0A8K0SHX4_9HYPO|nr:heterokaryon incompatibility protein-domain-containing protein [Stachybotrys elegans]